MEKIKQEESYYVDLPKIYAFTSEREKEVMLNRNFKRVNDEVKAMINELLGKAPEEWCVVILRCFVSVYLWSEESMK